MTQIFINEIHYDNDGADAGERIEIAAPAGTDLTGWRIVRYNGNNGQAYTTPAATETLSGTMGNLGSGWGVVVVSYPLNGLQNGDPDGIALVDPDGTVVQFLSYEGSFTATNGPANGLTSTDIGVRETASTPLGHSLRLTGTGDDYGDFAWAAPAAESFGAANAGQTFQGTTATAGISLSPAAPALAEGGAGLAVAIVLTAAPAANVTITLLPDADVAVSASQLVFTPADWNIPQQVTVTAVDDALVEGAHAGQVTLSVASADAAYAAVAAPAIQATITDNDVGLTRIHEVQGSGATSPLAGQVVTVEAIVTGDFQNGDADAARNLGGFYLVEEIADRDASAATSEGIFVAQGNLPTGVAIGDRVRVTGTVAESFGMTRLSATAITVTQPGAVADVGDLAVVMDLPAAGTTTIPGGHVPDLEAFEGMLVTIPQTLAITEQFNLDRFNEIRLTAGERPFSYTVENEPDAAGYQAHLRDIASRSIVYDDGLSVQNADIGLLDGFGPDYATANAPRMGDTVTDLTGVLAFDFSAWRVLAVEDGANDFVAANPRPAEAPEVGGSLRVASFNVLNFFTTLDDGGSTALGFEPRGANSAAEFARQAEKLLTTLAALDADVIGLLELENDFDPAAPGNAIAWIVDGLNDLLGETAYAWVDPGQRFVGGDAIAVGFIYDTRAVRIAEGSAVAILDDADLPGLGLSGLIDQSTAGGVFNGANTSRAAMAVTFEELASGGSFTASVNHFKSKGGTGTGADADAGDGAGAWNQQRLLAAQALDAWLATDPTGAADPDRLILGDLNAYFQEDPIAWLKARGWDSLQESLLGDGAYSYVFDGQRGALDHMLASASLSAQVTGIADWHINADEADALDYNLDFGRDPAIFDGTVPFRTSDHDPLVLGLSLAPEAALAFDLWRSEAAPGGAPALLREQVVEVGWTAAAGTGSDARADSDGPLTAAGLRFAAAEGDIAMTRLGFAGRQVVDPAGDAPAATLDWTGQAAVLRLDAAWNSVKAATVSEFTGSRLAVENFVTVAIALAGDADRDLLVEGAKRGRIETGGGDDRIVFGVDSNDGNFSNLVEILAGAGDDLVVLRKASRDYSGNRATGQGEDRWLRAEVTLGAGDDELFGATGGTDIAVYGDILDNYAVERLASGAVRVTDLVAANGDEGTDLLWNVNALRMGGTVWEVSGLLG